jgi:DNA-binding GntR family transcriptional regulator
MKSVNTDVAYEYIRKKILSGEFAPGQALMTEVLAKSIKVSRTPVRDALRKLETDGLVTIRAHLGANVKQMDLKEFRELCDLRLALESHSAGLAAKNRTDSDLQEMHFALESMRRLTAEVVAAPEFTPKLKSELVKEDVRFHIAIISAAKNDVMKREILRLHLINRLQATPPPLATPKPEDDARRLAVMRMHDDIYAAIAASDAAAAKRHMEFHLQELIDHNLALLTRAESGLLARELTFEEMAYSS